MSSTDDNTDSNMALNPSLQHTYPLQRQTKINNTDIISISYTDRHFVITQLYKFGTLIEAKVEKLIEIRIYIIYKLYLVNAMTRC